MFNFYKEKSDILSKLGSFYYKILANHDNIALNLSHTAFQTDIFNILNQTINSISNSDVFIVQHNNLIEFKDEDIKGYILDTDGNIKTTLIHGNYIGNEQLEEGDSLKFELIIPNDCYVQIIATEDNKLLFEHINFTSEFGKITFTHNPIAIFSNMRLLAKKVLRRKRNIMCYPLGLQEVYGDTSYIIDYYKNNQSLSAFKKALYQSIGMVIIVEEDFIVDKLPTETGYIYITNKGKQYQADYNHNELAIGDIVHKDQIIGEELLKVYLPEDTIPTEITGVQLLTSSIQGDNTLIIPNEERSLYTNNKFNPTNFVTGTGLPGYVQYVNDIGRQDILQYFIDNNTTTLNCIEFLRNIIANNRCIILDIDEDNIPENMFIRIKSFIIDNAPINCLVLKAYKESLP